MLMHTSFFYDKECQNSEKMCRNDRKNTEKRAIIHIETQESCFLTNIITFILRTSDTILCVLIT